MSIELSLRDVFCHVNRPNARHEKHGDDDVLAADVPLRVMNLEDWARVAAQCWSEPVRTTPNEAGERLLTLASWCESMLLVDKNPRLHDVVLNMHDGCRVAFVNAKVNKVRMMFDDLGMTLRIQGRVSSDDYALLLDMWGQKCLVTVTPGVEDEPPPDEPKEQQTEIDTRAVAA